jgi:hypothetical protein
MQNQPLAIIVKPNLITRVFWLFFGLIALGIGIFSIGKPIGGFPEWLSPLVFHLGAIGVGVLSLIKLITIKAFILRKDELEVSSMFGLNQRIIPRSHVISMMEIEKSGEDSKWKECTLFTNYGKLKLSEQVHTNYADAMLIIREQWQIKKDTLLLTKELTKNKLIQGIVNLAIGGAIFMCLHQIKKVYELVPRSELVDIKSQIVNDISLTPTGKNDESINILVAAYPGFNFKMDRNAKSVISKTDFEQIAIKGDSIIFTISNRDYQKKLAKTESLNIWEQYINYPNIPIYGLRNNAITILNPDDYISVVTGLGGDNSWADGFFFKFLIFMFIASGVKNLYDYIMAIL